MVLAALQGVLAAKAKPGVGRLCIDDQLVGETHSDTFAAFHYGESFDIGRDRFTSVCLDYDGPFAFSGQVKEVRVLLR